MASSLSLCRLLSIGILGILICGPVGLGNQSTTTADNIDDLEADDHVLEETVIEDPEVIDPPLNPHVREILKCANTNHVCGTMMRYRSGYTADEGANCECKSCSTEWNSHDRKSLTWHHYERNDWLVQYRFCAPIINERECKGDELAAVMETNIHLWNIRMRKSRCHCPSGEYYTSGWSKKDDTWRYNYVCSMPICEAEQTCTKIYVDLEEEIKVGYQFTCACPDDSQCPTEYDVTGLESWEEDDKGDYVTNKCFKHRKRQQQAKKETR